MFHVKHFEVKGSWVQRFNGSSLYPRAAHSAHLSHFRTFSTLSAYSKNLRILSNLSVGLAVILASEEPQNPQPLQNPQNPFPMEPKNLKPQTFFPNPLDVKFFFANDFYHAIIRITYIQESKVGRAALLFSLGFFCRRKKMDW